MKSEKTWHVVYTRPGWEVKVALLLTKKHVENYCPLNKLGNRWADNKKAVITPLFTSYVFVRIHDSDQVAIKQTKGVLNFAYWLGEPAVISDEDIETIRSFLIRHGTVRLTKIPVHAAEMLHIVDAPQVSLPSLHYTMIAEKQKSKTQVIQISIPAEQIRI